MLNNSEQFVQSNSPDGGFLQSEAWRKFQEAYGRRTFSLAHHDFHASIVEHQLPLVGKYFYVPRGPIVETQNENPCPKSQHRCRRVKIENDNAKLKNYLTELLDLSKKEKIGWIRIEPANNETLRQIKKSAKHKIVKAPHDMQPQEILVVDIAKSEEQLLSEMKPKTRYNLRLAQRHGISIITIANQDQKPSDKTSMDYLDEFIRLVGITSKRQGIVSHSAKYYRKMWEMLPKGMLKLYVAEYQGQVVAANLMLFYGKTATYLHGASDDQYRNVMAPYLLQWRAIQDAKVAEYERYDFGGVAAIPDDPEKVKRESSMNLDRWAGITKFKTGFSANTKPVVFPGSFDIIIESKRYLLYRIVQRVKSLLKK
ncbi:peptidoglycan bridge formation glycyltransferase FemA/FemB family protein [Patescibacteria group bacterium]|nr:MAG: peptidoglycan bridge formation glycyltransferase FemA/FemB family protein [Patescibacteria group bacterium]